MNVSLTDGVSVVAGPLKHEDVPRQGWLAEVLDSAAVGNLVDRQKGSDNPKPSDDGVTTMAQEANTVEKDAEESAQAPADEGKTAEEKKTKESGDKAGECGPGTVMDEASGKCVPSKGAKELEVLGQFVSEKTAEALAPMFEKLAEGMTAIGTGMTAIAEKQAEISSPAATSTEEAPAEEAKTGDAKTEPKNETEEGKEDTAKTADLLKGLTDAVENLRGDVADVQKSHEALAKATPSETTREEVVEKGADKGANPNAVFDSAWPFLKG